jgi:predicted ATPase
MLDNCEQIRDEVAALVADLLRGLPGVAGSTPATRS